MTTTYTPPASNAANITFEDAYTKPASDDADIILGYTPEGGIYTLMGIDFDDIHEFMGIDVSVINKIMGIVA